MDILLQMAIDLACQLQADPRCEAVAAAAKAADEDETLQQLISEFNLKRIAINTEESKEDGEQNAEKIRQLNTELRSIYASVMANERMMAYNEAKSDLDVLVNKMHLAINLAAQGQDPNQAALESNCTGNCGTCGGCH
ncbi:MAG: YlbF family regulator [Clostridia bacterium]|nr:YlbF family regulator [Clostridia bacterium]